MLQVRNLTVRYQLKSGGACAAVQDVSFHIEPGETLGLMGESGSGKSSIALAVLGLLPERQTQCSGRVLFDNSDLLTLSECELQKIRGASISLVFQEPEIALSPMMSVGNQIAEVIRAHGRCSRKECCSAARAMLDRVGFVRIERIYHSYPHQLSGGQRQRIVLAQALACGPALLIADEPTAHLDLCSQVKILDLLESLKRKSDISILLISHAPDVQARMADRLLIMQAGRTVEQGRFHELCRNSRDPYVRTILGSPLLPRERTENTVEERSVAR